MTERPELAVKFASVISSWAAVEVELASSLCEAMEASAEPFAAAFQALNSTAAQSQVAEAAIKTVIEDNLADVFDILMTLFRAAKKVRDRLAHGMWGWSDRLPDSLLLLDPKRIVMRESMFVQNSKLSQDGLTRLSDCGGKYVITSEHIMVYDGKDFDQAFEHNKRLAFLFTRFRWCVWPPMAKDPSTLHLLVNEPEIAEGLARIEQKKRTRAAGGR